MDSPSIPRLPRRNVEVPAPDGHVIVGMSLYLVFFFFRNFVPSIANAGFWHYGTLRWDEFYKYLASFVVTNVDWQVFQYDPAQRQPGWLCESDNQIVQPGQYILLSVCK